MKDGIRLSIVIVNWKVSELVAELLGSIADGTRGLAYEILLVDNASADGMGRRAAEFKQNHPEIPLVFLGNDRNLGFAAACNQAIRLSRGDYVVLLNPDTRAPDGALENMVRWLDAHPEAGIAGPKLLNADGTVQRSVRRLPRLSDQTLIMLKLHHLSARLPILARHFAADFDYSKPAEVEQVMGAAFFIRREVIERIGLLDERFFIWFEEVDFCKRARDAGFKVMYTPAASIYHLGGTSFAQVMTYRKQKYFAASLLKYFRKHRGLGAAAALLPAVLFGLAAAGGFTIWKSLSSKKK